MGSKRLENTNSGGAEKPELASSPCSIHELNEIYGGYAEMGEVKSILLTLLEAERAGAQVCALSLKEAPSKEWQGILQEVRRDEAASCKLLIACLENLGMKPNEEIGDFVEKCMSIPSFVERMQLLNKGQAWVVRKLDDLLPRLQPEFVREKLLQMKNEHQENILKLEAFLDTELIAKES